MGFKDNAMSGGAGEERRQRDVAWRSNALSKDAKTSNLHHFFKKL